VGVDLQPLAGVNVGVLGHTSTTGIDGRFSIGGVPTLQPAVIVGATLVVNATVLSGNSAAVPPVRGGTTDVGDIIAASTGFEGDLGTLIPRCDYCDVDVSLPFPFPIGGQIRNQIHINNGYLWTDEGDYLDAFCCDLQSDGGPTGSGLYVNDQLPGRLVVTWYRQLTFDTGDQLNTIQVVLFADGRIQYGYQSASADAYADTGLWPANRNTGHAVDFSAISSLTIGANEVVYEYFDPYDNRFDLSGGFIVFTPDGSGGYEVHPVPDVVPPVCTIDNPVNGATLFHGEALSIAAAANDNGSIARVVFTSSAGGLNTEVTTAPYSVPFVVPGGVGQITFTATAYDGWQNQGICTATVTVIPGPPPAVTITSPIDGTTVTAGATIPIVVDAANRVPVATVDLRVNGVPLTSDPAAPFEFLFTVPAGVDSLSLTAAAVDTVGNTATSQAVNVAVAADPLTTVQGQVVDRSANPISGADVTLDVHGAAVEVFDFDTPLSALPDLTGRTPNRVTAASAVNLRNPGGVFGTDPFGFGPSASHAARLTATLQTVGSSNYTFKLGVNGGGRLIVNGTTVIDIPAATGQFQEATGTIAIGVGSIPIQILTFDNGNPEVQLSYGADGATALEVVPPSRLKATLYHATSQADGSFAIAGVSTSLGSILARASAVVNGRMSRGHSADTAPIAGGTTDVGTVKLGSSGLIGYYDLSRNAGDPAQVAPIAVVGGLQAIDVGDLNTADLSQFDVLFVQNPDNNGYSFAFRNNLAKVHQFVANGGTLVFHDRHVATAASILPGAPGTFVRSFTDDANIEIVDDTTLVTDGPGGRVTATSLDGGNSSSHGWIDAASIPAGARGILSQGNPAHLVTYSYGHGLGTVVYSTIPLDYYLDGFGVGGLNANMRNYAANVVAYANDLR
jgi:hypothetical protein